MRLPNLLVVLLTALTSLSTFAQPTDSAPRLAAQREAMKPLAWMDGVWRGPAWTVRADGTRHSITQTERIGPFLDGTVRLIEGRGYDADGKVGFNAFGTITFDPATKRYSMISHALGNHGSFPLTPTADGYVWEAPTGPGAVMRYTAVVKDGQWRQIGEYVAAGQPPRQTFEMNLQRLGDTGWPAEGAVPQR